MPLNGPLRLTQILHVLAGDFASKYDDQDWELRQQVEDIGYDAFVALDEGCELNRRIAAFERETEQHPLRGFVRMLGIETGIDRRELEEAARRGFNGDGEIVAELRKLDADGTTTMLVSSLYAHWPAAVVRILGAMASETAIADVPGVNPKKRGRRKADSTVVKREARLAANWERARDAGVHKHDFARGVNTTVKVFNRLLGRVAKRKLASEELLCKSI